MWLRVKDIDFEYGQITVRDGKGDKDRVTMLPQGVVELLRAHLEKVKDLHNQDLAAGFGEVYLPYALASAAPGHPCPRGMPFILNIKVSECVAQVGLAVRVSRTRAIRRPALREAAVPLCG